MPDIPPEQSLIEYPCDFPIKVMGPHVPGYLDAIVAVARGEWSQAEAVARESLSLRRQLVDRLGDTPEALRDL